MEAHIALMQPIQVYKITSSCEIYGGPHDTQCCMEDPEQAFIDYASSCNNEVGDREFTTNLGLRNFKESGEGSVKSNYNQRAWVTEMSVRSGRRKLKAKRNPRKDEKKPKEKER
ncbi:hypothetical protein Tco_0359811 [Tanacetum coccineum]